MANCIFCKIVKGELPCHKIWETDTHLAFLSIFPNIKGFSVVIPKKHLDSYVFNLEKKDFDSLLEAAQSVGKILDKALNVARTAMIAEGMGVDHAHIKLFPLIGVKPGEPWEDLHLTKPTHFKEYEGYVSSHDASRADDKELTELAKKILQVSEDL